MKSYIEESLIFIESDDTKFSEIFPELHEDIIADKTIEELDLSVRTYNYLRRARINSLKKLLSMSMNDLMNIHRRKHEEIIEKLREYAENTHR